MIMMITIAMMEIRMLIYSYDNDDDDNYSNGGGTNGYDHVIKKKKR